MENSCTYDIHSELSEEGDQSLSVSGTCRYICLLALESFLKLLNLGQILLMTFLDDLLRKLFLADELSESFEPSVRTCHSVCRRYEDLRHAVKLVKTCTHVCRK